MSANAKHTNAPWNICWSEYNGRKVNFEITASPYGSVRPLCRSDWKTDWSEVEGDELVANAHLIAAAPDLHCALSAAQSALKSYQYGNASTELAAEIAAFADRALAKAEGRS